MAFQKKTQEILNKALHKESHQEIAYLTILVILPPFSYKI